MPDPRALAAADAVLALINSQPRTPTREQLAALIASHVTPAAAPAAQPRVMLSPEGEAFREAAEWEIGLMRASVTLGGTHPRIVGESSAAISTIESAARRVWGRPATGWGDVAARAVVAAHLPWNAFDDRRWQGSDGRMKCKLVLSHPGVPDGTDELIAAVERVSGIRRVVTGFDDGSLAKVRS
jgi:hypothetical protein